MGSLRDSDGLNDPIIGNRGDHFCHAQTQAFDSQFSPPPSPGEKVEDNNNDQSHFDYAIPVEDVNETQVLSLDDETQALNLGGETQTLDLVNETQALNFGDETQALNLGGETQALNLGGETQALNLGGETQALCYFDGAENMETQVWDVFDNEVANDSDNEGSDGTEVLGEGNCISDDDSARPGSNQPLDKEKMRCISVCEQGEKDLTERHDPSNLGSHDSTATPVIQCTPQPQPGSVPRFTSIRAASLRAFALATHSIASREINKESCYILTNGLFSNKDAVRNYELEPKDLEEIDNIHDMSKENDKDKELWNGNKCRIGSSIVRKLFTEDSLSQDKGLPDNGHNANGGENLLQFPVCDEQLAGLSYVDSQEPGDFSQDNALKFVETFIEKNNFVQFDHGVDHGKSTGGKSKPFSTANGPQSLAKKSNYRNTVGKTWIFDWDDSHEDEGGGDIFCKYFGTGCHLQRSFTGPQKLKKQKLDSYRHDEQPAVHDKIMIPSDSRVMLLNKKWNKKEGDGEMIVERNFANELDEQLNADSSRGQLESADCMTDVSQMLNVGPDTQMAAEAMEALLSGEGITNHGINDLQSNSNNSGGKSKNRVSAKLSSSRKRVCLSDVGIARKQNKNTKWTIAELSKYSPVSSVLHAKRNCCKSGSNQFGELENADASRHEQLDPGLTITSNAVDTLRYPRRRRSCRNLSGRISGFKKLDCQSKSSVQPEDIRQSITVPKRSRNNARSSCVNLIMNRKTRSSAHACAILSSTDRSLEGKLSEKSLNESGQWDAALGPTSAGMNTRVKSSEFMGVKAVNHSDRNSVLDPQPSAGNAETNSRLDKSSREQCKANDSACSTPLNRVKPVNAASPVCMGNEYFKQSCKKVKEISRLIATEPEPISPLKDLRKRKDMASIQVLFSRHLDEDIIKQQKKILGRLGASVATSITDATHFITDEFVRTRNMLEAIAYGKPVVTHLWLESIGQVKVHIDEESYLLRDTKKEKEFGFSMPATFARARKHPLLQGRRVFITPNIKPNKETISSLVKAVHGQALERLGRSGLKDDKVPDDLLILSCEEDYEICVPFLEKGAAVYSSELLLNGIVTQKLEYERHRLFADNVKRTRSTIWLRKDGHKFHRVRKLK
ncbi:BRCT domain-containing DNA repair protein, putative isoform 1 [Melia azedarach]|uniref:BRCT domain-containing DNA repair protein, putative isoform 1 n=1 Tax=Melia azedarach TaxID=155640 RepID=A0ACC1YGA3_MELAZ|nr:BRCT domain-containing DNA repair protein, putative isoform 1 [Melia azedarach]